MLVKGFSQYSNFSRIAEAQETGIPSAQYVSRELTVKNLCFFGVIAPPDAVSLTHPKQHTKGEPVFKRSSSDEKSSSNFIYRFLLLKIYYNFIISLKNL
jgi:hypothetical protein